MAQAKTDDLGINPKNINYAYEQMARLVQYTDNASRWSPNNIRRIIISPDALFMLRHYGDKIGKIEIPFGNHNSVRLDRKCYAESLQDPNVKSIISALMQRVPMLLEEVVVCTESSTGNSLVPMDQDIQGLLVGYKGQSQDIEGTIKKRYKRLAAFIVFKGTYQEFLSGIDAKLNEKGNYLLSKDKFVKDSRKCTIYKLNEDWYKTCTGNPKDYPVMDKAGGPINSRLMKIREHLEKQMKDREFEKFKEENGVNKEDLTKETKEFKTAYDNAELITKCIEIFVRLYSKVGVLPYCSDITMFEMKKQDLKESQAIDKSKLPHCFKVTEKAESEKDALLYNTNVARNTVTDLYSKMLTLLYDVMDNYKNHMGDIDIITHITEGYDKSIMVPPGLEGRNSTLLHPFQGKRLSDSIANICTLLSCIYLKENAKQKKESWIN